jgi:hypothetical protein
VEILVKTWDIAESTGFFDSVRLAPRSAQDDSGVTGSGRSTTWSLKGRSMAWATFHPAFLTIEWNTSNPRGRVAAVLDSRNYCESPSARTARLFSISLSEPYSNKRPSDEQITRAPGHVPGFSEIPSSCFGLGGTDSFYPQRAPRLAKNAKGKRITQQFP